MINATRINYRTVTLFYHSLSIYTILIVVFNNLTFCNVKLILSSKNNDTTINFRNLQLQHEFKKKT